MFTAILRFLKHAARMFGTGLAYAGACAFLPILSLVTGNGSILAANQPPPPLEQAFPAPPAYDPSKPTAVILAGNIVTEVSDLMAPYEVLAASGRFNVFVVAPERRLSRLNTPGYHCCVAMDLVPHYSFAEYDREIGVAPDLMVVPYIPEVTGADAAVLSWMRQRPDDHTVILTICSGSQTAAESGILAGHRATSHHMTLPIVEKTHPEVNWVHGLRYVDDGRIISSAGVTSGVDASLYTVERFFGRAAADETAQRMGYPHTEYLDDPTWIVPDDSDIALVPDLFRIQRTQIGLFLYQGVGEVELSSVAGTYPNALTTDIQTVGATREIIQTQHGLDLVPRYALGSVPSLDRLLVPGEPDATIAQPADRWAMTHLGGPAERIDAGGVYPYDATVMDLAQHETRLVARSAAIAIEYPVGQLNLGTHDWSLMLVVRPILLALVGAALLTAVRRRRTAKRARRATYMTRQALAA